MKGSEPKDTPKLQDNPIVFERIRVIFIVTLNDESEKSTAYAIFIHNSGMK